MQRLSGVHLLLTCMVLLTCLPQSILAVDRNKFRTCAHTDFCRRLRASTPGRQNMNYAIRADEVKYDEQTATIYLPLSSGTFPGQPPLDAKIFILNDGVVRMTARESHPLHPRHQVQDVLELHALRPFEDVKGISVKKTTEEMSFEWKFEGKGDSYRPQMARSNPTALPSSHKAKLVIAFNPFHLKFLVDDVVVMLANSENLMTFEQYRERNAQPQAPFQPTPPNHLPEHTPEQINEANMMYSQALSLYEVQKNQYDQSLMNQLWPFDTSGAWEESYNGHTDHKSRGPSALSLDIIFPNTKQVYGIPEHASTFALKNTIKPNREEAMSPLYQEPYRLYNLDVFEYELNEPMALYGAVPYIAAHTADGKNSMGVLWLNPSETYVDVGESGGDGGLFSSGSLPQKSIHWMSETGLFDVFFLMGPKPSSLISQLTELTGHPFLPPLFSIAYHQCRWNYKSESDVAAVDSGFDEHDIPYDVLWLDIEHTEGKKYFTWDRNQFPTPKVMQQKLAAKGRKNVNIVDPHIKRDQNYFVHSEATSLGHYIKKNDGTDYDGWCWPGSSSYLDFFQKRVREFWAGLFTYERYEGSTPTLFIWNDMNEPSVFNGPEVSMPKDCLHTLDGIAEKVEHREVHNQYGMYVHMATANALIERSNRQQRPFVLTRAFFAGSQKTAAVWTGDNMAKWDHLAIATPMVLSLSIAQIPFAGADVGGFFGDPDPQLLTRWYQTAAFQPFFRGHAHIDTKRREPWLFGEPYTSIIRQAIRTRYQYLPYFYTLFYNNHKSGMPITRPLVFEFPQDPKTFGAEESFLLGADLLVQPVAKQDQVTSLVYLPTSGIEGVNEVWYDLATDSRHAGGETVNVLTPLQHIPVYQRGGSIIAKRERARRSSPLMLHDPYTLVIAPSAHRTAVGQLYIDDTATFNYQNGQYLFITFALSAEGILSGTPSNPTHNPFEDKNTIERIILLMGDPATSSGGESERFTQAMIIEGVDASGNSMKNVPLTVTQLNGGRRLVIRKPDVRVGSSFKIKLF